VTREQALVAERLRRATQELLDRWYPGTGVTVDWTGDAHLLQIARGMRLAAPIFVVADRLKSLEDKMALRREVLTAAWALARGIGGNAG
jgi:hypothetical protein